MYGAGSDEPALFCYAVAICGTYSTDALTGVGFDVVPVLRQFGYYNCRRRQYNFLLILNTTNDPTDLCIIKRLILRCFGSIISRNIHLSFSQSLLGCQGRPL